MSTKTIVLAWTETVMVPDGKLFAKDLGAQSGMVEQTEAHACIWLNKGSPADTVKAQAHVTAEHPKTGRVYCYQTTTKNPLDRARRMILEKYTTARRAGRSHEDIQKNGYRS